MGRAFKYEKPKDRRRNRVLAASLVPRWTPLLDLITRELYPAFCKARLSARIGTDAGA